MTSSSSDRRVAAYHYELPAELIARVPAEPREAARLLVVTPDSPLRDCTFADFPALLSCGDVLVINETRVVPARLHGTRSGGGRTEVLLLGPRDRDAFDYGAREWFALVRPAKRSPVGARIDFGTAAAADVIAVLPDGPRVLRFADDVDLQALIEQRGEVPLPPYVGPGDPARAARYQTIFARVPGSVAAPTASLHFSADSMAAIQARGVTIVPLVLDVGLGTFRPMSGETIDDHVMHTERYAIPPATATAIAQAKTDGRRVIAAGTTVLRALESAAAAGGTVAAGSRTTNLFISPGFRFRIVDALLTNFHLPQSTLLVLVAAFAGREHALAAYRHAIARHYRFFSFGDAMFIVRPRDMHRTELSAATVSTRDDVLNLARLEEAYDNDRVAIANLLGLARETEFRYIAALRDGITHGDLRAVARAAHSIKGSASNIGALHVSRIAADIEDQARLDSWDGITGFAAELDRRYAELRLRIEEYAAKIV